MGTLSPNIGLTIPTVGGDPGPTFAQDINGSLGQVDAMLGGSNILNVAGGSNITLTQTQAQNLNQIFTGPLLANITVFFPAAPASGGAWGITNLTPPSPFTLSVGIVGGQNTLVVPQGSSIWAFADSALNMRTSAPLHGWSVLSSAFVQSQSSVLLQLPRTYQRFKLTMQNMALVQPDTAIIFQMSADGGNSTPGVTYATVGMINILGGQPVAFNENNASDPFIVATPLLNTGTYPFDGVYEISCGTFAVNIESTGGGMGSNGGAGNSHFVFTMHAAAALGAANAIVISGGSQFSGNIILEGLT